MLIKVSDPTLQTVFFSIIFLSLLLLSIRKNDTETFFSKEATNQLKGFSILAIIFSHIGYFLSSDTRFLYPFSVLAGVGVNLFLFLSGFGLTISQINSPLSPLQFYQKRLFRLFIPMWTVIIIFFAMDFFILNKSYPLSEIVQGFLGFFPRADIFINLDSPLWYFTVIFFYYLIFPLVSFRKILFLSPLLVLFLSLFVLKLPLPIDKDVLKLYNLHFLAFPLGMLFGLSIQHIKLKLNKFLKLFVFSICTIIFLYTSIHSGVSEGPKIEQIISLITALSLAVIFAFSRFDFRLLSVFGIYSYEIYLLHWPILSRYNLFLGIPPVLDIILNLGLILFLGYALQKAIEKISRQN